jgi:hypothetical protein
MSAMKVPMKLEKRGDVFVGIFCGGLVARQSRTLNLVNTTCFGTTQCCVGMRSGKVYSGEGSYKYIP